MRHIIFLFIMTMYWGCGETIEGINTNKKAIEHNLHYTPLNELQQLNVYRKGCGVQLLKEDASLSKAATSHSKYLVESKTFGHYEEDTSFKNFTGRTPLDRINFVGYAGNIASEVVNTKMAYVGHNDKRMIDGLMTAIYHRFGMLDRVKDVSGYGLASSDTISAFTMEFSNSKVADICSDPNYVSREGYNNVCYNGKRINKDDYIDALFKDITTEPVPYPYNGQTDAGTVFYEESPDPLPECSYSGLPVSVVFDNLHDVTMKDFTLLKNGVDSVKAIKVASSDNDERFTQHEFAFFPLHRLEFDTKYVAIFTYVENDVEHTYSWQFKTMKLPYRLLKSVRLLGKIGDRFFLDISEGTCVANASSVYYDSGAVNVVFWDRNLLFITVLNDRYTNYIQVGDKKVTILKR